MQLDKALLAYEIDLRAENKFPHTVRPEGPTGVVALCHPLAAGARPARNARGLPERAPRASLRLWGGRIVRSVAEAAGVNGKSLSPHTVRHAAAEAFLRNGGDAFALQKLLGHSSLTVTRMYVDLVATDLQDAHKRASRGDNLRVRRRA